MNFLPKELEDIIMENKTGIEKHETLMGELVEYVKNRNITYEYTYIDGGFGDENGMYYGTEEGNNVLYFIREGWLDDCCIYEHHDRYMFEFEIYR